ncbi:MAG: S24 family peptidase [Sphingobium sp.]|nr:S24 family peptidase [Sphingobium sp.]
MDLADARLNLERLIRERGENFGSISKLLGRNAAYIQQFVRRGTPRKLDEADRHLLARYFGVDERLLGAADSAEPRRTEPGPSSPRAGADAPALCVIPRLGLDASAGPGALDQAEDAAGALAFDPAWVRALGAKPDMLSIIRVAGESMMPTLGDGDDIMVDRADGPARLRDGIYVLRMDDVLMVKRLALTPRPGRIAIRSDNPLYPAFEDVDPRAVTIVGRVVWAGRRVG